MHENDRSATGFLPPAEFDVVVDAFFAQPKNQRARLGTGGLCPSGIVREMEAVLDRAPHGHVLVVGHGAVGTLLLCHYRKIPISRAHDQPAGGRRYFTVLRATGAFMEKPPSALA